MFFKKFPLAPSFWTIFTHTRAGFPPCISGICREHAWRSVTCPQHWRAFLAIKPMPPLFNVLPEIHLDPVMMNFALPSKMELVKLAIFDASASLTFWNGMHVSLTLRHLTFCSVRVYVIVEMICKRRRRRLTDQWQGITEKDKMINRSGRRNGMVTETQRWGFKKKKRKKNSKRWGGMTKKEKNERRGE